MLRGKSVDDKTEDNIVEVVRKLHAIMVPRPDPETPGFTSVYLFEDGIFPDWDHVETAASSSAGVVHLGAIRLPSEEDGD